MFYLKHGFRHLQRISHSFSFKWRIYWKRVDLQNRFNILTYLKYQNVKMYLFFSFSLLKKQKNKINKVRILETVKNFAINKNFGEAKGDNFL